MVEALRDADEPVLMIGGGSNLVIADAGWPGTVVRISTRGRRVERRPDGSVLLTVEAGEEWDDVVAATVADGLGGLECLSGIPGPHGRRAGAERRRVRGGDRRRAGRRGPPRPRGVVRRVPAADLGLAYRTSVLKGRSDAVVLRVRIALPGDGRSAPIRYAELASPRGGAGDRVPAAVAREAVLALRRGKGMVLDPADHDTWSAGSFFTNPVLRGRRPPGAPTWPVGDRVKVSAAWLIERAGFRRGHAGPGGRVALSGRHVLALTHRGGGSTADLLALAAEVRDGVQAGSVSR